MQAASQDCVSWVVPFIQSNTVVSPCQGCLYASMIANSIHCRSEILLYPCVPVENKYPSAIRLVWLPGSPQMSKCWVAVQSRTPNQAAAPSGCGDFTHVKMGTCLLIPQTSNLRHVNHFPLSFFSFLYFTPLPKHFTPCSFSLKQFHLTHLAYTITPCCLVSDTATVFTYLAHLVISPAVCLHPALAVKSPLHAQSKHCLSIIGLVS